MRLTEEEKMLAERDVQERFPKGEGGFMFFKGLWVGLVNEKTGEVEWLPEQEQMPVEELTELIKKRLEFEEVKKELHRVYDERMAELFRNGRKRTDKVKQCDAKLKQLMQKVGLEQYRFIHPDALNVLKADGTMTEYPIQEQQQQYYN
jgi:predicted nuclease with TOPRIM domain